VVEIAYGIDGGWHRLRRVVSTVPIRKIDLIRNGAVRSEVLLREEIFAAVVVEVAMSLNGEGVVVVCGRQYLMCLEGKLSERRQWQEGATGEKRRKRMHGPIHREDSSYKTTADIRSPKLRVLHDGGERRHLPSADGGFQPAK
jgi:hypothetical protein